jgi:MbtH protein
MTAIDDSDEEDIEQPMPFEVVSDDEDDIERHMPFEVVVNDEEQYSIWPADRPPPAGWRTVGVSGSKSRCLDHIEAVWTDMRPKSLRERR